MENKKDYKYKDVLDMLERKPNDKQLAAIECLDNCVVGAGAGSGKTMVLSSRFLRLVMDGLADCDQILTLTFTKKAASEMYQRIHGNLLTYRDKNSDLPRQIAMFPKATISTIDSFCAQIVRQDCSRYGLPKDFTMDDDITKNNAIHCIENLIETDTMMPGFQYLSKAYSPDDLVDKLLIPIANQCLFMPLEIDTEILMKNLNRIVDEGYQELVEKLSTVVKSIIDVPTKELTKTQKELVKQFIVLSELVEDDRSSLEDIASCVASIKFRMPSGKKDSAVILKEYCTEFRDIQPEFVTFASMKAGNNSREIFDAIKVLKDNIFQEKRRTGVLTFSDVANLSVDILKTNKEVRTFMKKKFRYIMIDEFQDNNELQKDLLFLLSEKYDQFNEGIPTLNQIEKQKLFFVGDEKQSIYRFRGADVSVFKSLADEIVESGGQKLSLETNYRSEPDLIKFFNNIFPTIMENEGEPYEAKFEELGYKPASKDVKPKIKALIKQYYKDEMLENPDEEAGESFSSEAVAVANEIAKALYTDAYLLKDGKRPTVNDIAILMEKKSGQMYYEKALRSKDIPYVILDNKSLTQEALTNDIYCILQLLIFPKDKISLAATLRGPFAKLSDDAIFYILHSKCDERFSVDEDVELNEDDLMKLECFKDTFRTLEKKAKSSTNSELLDYLFYEAGLRYYYVSEPAYQSYLSSYDYLYRYARGCDNKSLSSFLDLIRPQLGQISQLNETLILQEESDGVKIMTIHKSKGLEFPLVFICCMGSSPMSKQSMFLQKDDVPYTRNYKENGSYKNFIQELLSERDKKELLAEKKRVLYVAMTRAETHLVLVGTFNKQNRNISQDPQKNNNLLLMSLYGAKVEWTEDDSAGRFVSTLEKEPRLECEEIPLVSTKQLFTDVDKTYMKNRDTYKKSVAFYDNPLVTYNSEPYTIAVTKLFGHKDDGAFNYRKGNRLSSIECDTLLEKYSEEYPSIYADFGTLCHSFVEEGILHNDEPKMESVLKSDSPLLKLSEAEQKLFIESARIFKDNFINSKFYESKVLGKEIRCEVGFFSRVEYKGKNVVAEGFIDLLIKDEDNNYLVVDFKTDTIKNPVIHETQLSTYKKVVQQMYPSSTVKCALAYLRSPDDEYYFE
jgi:ATP-dependent exoDNAse (exonuclease V) beta subunit